jgi:hypothetical protein
MTLSQFNLAMKNAGCQKGVWRFGLWWNIHFCGLKSLKVCWRASWTWLKYFRALFLNVDFTLNKFWI